MGRRDFGGLVVECVLGDITDQPDVDAIVNAANARLAPGDGVAGAIHRKAGGRLHEECKPLAPISTGRAVITGGHGLPNDWCIHALGPVYGSSPDPRGELASAYQQALARAEEKGLRSVATPALSTGIFGFPMAEAAEVAIGTVAAAAADLRTVRLVRFVLWDPSDLRTHDEMLESV